MDTFKCICGRDDFTSSDQLDKHIRGGRIKAPEKHARVIVAADDPSLPADFHEPTAPDKPCSDCEVAIDPAACEQCTISPAAEVCQDCMAYINSCPGAGVVAAELEEAEKNLVSRVHARFEQASPPAEGAGDASVKAELPGPAVSLDDDKPNRTGIYIVVSALAFVAFVVLVILKVRGVIPG